MGAFGPNIHQLDARSKKLEKLAERFQQFDSFLFQTMRKQDQILAMHDSVLNSLKTNLINKGVITEEEYTKIFEESKASVKQRSEDVLKQIQEANKPTEEVKTEAKAEVTESTESQG
jgi:TPP-dependent pyruvate/acetoin dehydrogenase alpha subunit